jgi:hypothetical protein
MTTIPTATRLIFDTLQPFEFVRDQYRDYGIQFDQAIALAPTNPAFAHHANSLVLMPTAGHTSLLMRFAAGISHIRTSVIGVRQISLVALDAQGQVLARHVAHGKRSLHRHRDLVTPLPCLTLTASGHRIYQVALLSDAPFVVNDLQFSAPGSPEGAPAAALQPDASMAL